MAAPSMPGTAYVLFHHVMGETNGVRGVWGYVRGGMGGISSCDRRRRPSCGGRDSDQRRSRADPGAERTGAKAWPWRTAPSSERRGWSPAPMPTSRSSGCSTARSCPTTSRQRSAAIDYGSASLKINVALQRATRLHRLPRRRAGPAAPRHDPHLSRPSTTSSKPTTTPSTAARHAIRSSSARFRRCSTTPWRPPGST